MERFSDKAIEILNELHTERLDYDSEYLPLINSANLLAAYEDTGLSPEEVRELAEKKKNGLLVELPCKNWLSIVFGEQEEFYGIDLDYDTEPICKIQVDNELRFTWYKDWKNVVILGTTQKGLGWDFPPEDVGETVFLTRKEAETRLRDKEAAKE